MTRDESNLRRGLAYAFLFSIPLWVLIIAIVLYLIGVAR